MPREKSPASRLLDLLNDGHELTYDDINASIGISDRQARRIIARLRNNDVPILQRRVRRKVIFFLAPEHRQIAVEPFHFNEEEIFALAVASESAMASLRQTPLGNPLASAFERLLSRLAPEARTFEMEMQPRRWHFGSAVHTPLDHGVFRAIQSAINECRSVKIDYFTASRNTFTTGRVIDPLLVALPGNSWLVVAYCHRRRRIIDFSLAGITRVEPCERFFTPPAQFDPDTYFRDRFSSLDGGEVFVVRILVEADRAAYFRRKTYHPTQQIEETHADGRIVVSYEVAGLEEIRSFIQSWGVGVTVLDPPELVRCITEEASVLAERYEPPG